MMLVKASKESEAGALPTREQIETMGKYNQELIDAGVMLAGDGLHPSSKGARIKFSGGKTTITDGPFPETKELLAGYWVIEAKSRDEAIEWAKRIPFTDGEEVELRQLFEVTDFPEDILPPEEAAREQAFRDKQTKAAKR
jgi:hypothetical protein